MTEQNDLDYVKKALQTNLFNISALEAKTEVPRSIIKKIIDGKKVKPYIVSALAEFFRQIGH